MDVLRRSVRCNSGRWLTTIHLLRVNMSPSPVQFIRSIKRTRSGSPLGTKMRIVNGSANSKAPRIMQHEWKAARLLSAQLFSLSSACLQLGLYQIPATLVFLNIPVDTTLVWREMHGSNRAVAAFALVLTGFGKPTPMSLRNMMRHDCRRDDLIFEWMSRGRFRDAA